MKNDKAIEISVKTVFAGQVSQEQAFLELVRRKRHIARTATKLDPSPKARYNGGVVFQDMQALERRICNE